MLANHSKSFNEIPFVKLLDYQIRNRTFLGFYLPMELYTRKIVPEIKTSKNAVDIRQSCVNRAFSTI